MATIMVYHRSWWHYYLVGGLFAGILRGDLFRTRSLHRTNQGLTDGALARWYSIREWRAQVQGLMDLRKISVLGPKADLVPLPAGRLKNAVLAALPAPLSRAFTQGLGMGTFLVSTAVKPLEAR